MNGTTCHVHFFSETSHSVLFRASPIPVQFKNPLSSDKQNGRDQKYLVEGNVYDEVDKGKVEAPVISQTFDNLGESL